MFIREKEFKELRYQVTQLERAVASLQYETQVWMPDSNGEPYQNKRILLNSFRGEDHILLVDIIKTLLDKLGYELKKYPSKPVNIGLVKK